MFRRAGVFALALVLTGCTYQTVLDDVHDGGPPMSGPKDASGIGPDGYCASSSYHSLPFAPQNPAILIVLDRSASMQSYFGSDTRQGAAQTALVEAISNYQAIIKFGFEQFPGSPSEPQCQPGSCCAGGVDPDPTLLDLTEIKNKIECIDPRGSSSCPSTGSDSPSHQALATAREYYRTESQSQYLPSDGGDRYVLLVTSSEPSCASESHDVCSAARQAASDLGNLGNPGGNTGVRIIVLSLGYQPAPGSCLSQISQTASSLRQPNNTSPLYTPSSQDELASNLDELLSAVARASCIMTSTSVPPSQAKLTVNIGPESIQEADGSNPNGWSYTDFNNSITFLGSACDDWVKSQYSKSQYSSPAIGYSCSPCGGPNACSNLWQQPQP